MKRSAVSWAFCALLILPRHVLALADDSATSQHLMPRPSCSVTIHAQPLRSGRSMLAIVGFSIFAMADASQSKYSYKTDFADRSSWVLDRCLVRDYK